MGSSLGTRVQDGIRIPHPADLAKQNRLRCSQGGFVRNEEKTGTIIIRLFVIRVDNFRVLSQHIQQFDASRREGRKGR